MKEEKAITLVTLAVTIVVLIILTGVSISTLVGDNGIITKAKEARENIELAQIEEQISLNQLYTDMTNEIELGTEGEVLESFIEFKRKIAEAITEKGIQTSETDSSDTMANNIRSLNTSESSVYEIKDEEGNSIPVPKGFYYVGGSLSTGVIISDNADDEYDGITDKTTWEYTRNLKGNQFVWIPCTTSEYKKSNVWNGITQTNTTLANAWWNTTTPSAELAQVKKYGGFYVGRYEAGLANTITEFTTVQKHTASNQIYNLDGVPQSKAGVVPWMFIDWTHAKANAESMYDSQYVSSGLITGTQWDVMLKKMVGKTIGETTGDSKVILTETDLTNSGVWGNYINNSISYTGRLARANSSAWTIEPFGTVTSGTTTTYSSDNGELLTTGASKIAQVYHIYDVAGNLWEWTEETSSYLENSQYGEFRGGGFIYNSSSRPVCYRCRADHVWWTGYFVGFRVVLYIR